MTVVDLFAGLGGWDHAARDLGLDPLGIEWNADACATREAVGLRTLQADIATLDPADFAPCEGLIASPPCQDFSVAGKGAGRDGERGRLVEEVPRWVETLRPRWVACEQVPPVLPIWREFAHRMGGDVSAGVQAAIRCEHDGCKAYHRGPHWHPASDPGQAVLEARMSAQADGWQTRRNHSGRDLCPVHRVKAVA